MAHSLRKKQCQATLLNPIQFLSVKLWIKRLSLIASSSQIPTGHTDNQELVQTETTISRKLTMDINQHKHTSCNVSNNSSASSGVQSEEAIISPTEEHDNPIIDKSTIPHLPTADLIDRLLQRPPIINSPSIEQKQ